MDVKYDARAETSEKSLAPLTEWLDAYPKLEDALRTCSLRFVLTLPEDSLRNAPRLCFELQEAFWFYLDYLLENDKRSLPRLNRNCFFHLMMEASDILRSIYCTVRERQQIVSAWRQYCRKVPLKGAVLFNESLDKCLMVQPWKGDKWTFPRGKINEGEEERDCAIREVWEETGVQLETNQLDTGQYVEADVHNTGCGVKLFLVCGIREEVDCMPNTRKEISKIGWIKLIKLPGWDNSTTEAEVRTIWAEPFVPGIKRWVQGRRAAVGLPPLGDGPDAGGGAAAPGRRARARRRSPDTEEARGDAAVPLRGPRRSVSRPLVGSFSQPALAPAMAPARGRGEASGPSRREKAGHTFFAPSPPHRGAERGMDARRAVNRRSSFLDMAKVMREFDRGWYGAAKRHSQGR